MSKFFHQMGALFGVAMAVVPQLLPVLPTKAGNVLVSVTGVAWTLVTSLGKAFGGKATDKGVR
jgi:hypothetical protein